MRSLATGHYTAAQVRNVLHGTTRKWRARVEVLDRQRNATGLSGTTAEDFADPRGSPNQFVLLSGSVTFDTGRTVCGSFSFDMLPFTPFANGFLKYLLRVYLGVGPMPDGGYAEFAMGEYLTMRPARDIRAVGPNGRNIEVWTMTCPDPSYLLSIGGPRAAGFKVAAGDLISDGIKNAYDASGYGFDLSRVEESGIAATESLSWTWQSGATRNGRIVTEKVVVPEKRRWQFKDMLGNVIKGVVAGPVGPIFPPNAFLGGYGASHKEVVTPAHTEMRSKLVGEEAQEDSGVTWLDIIATLHRQLGWCPPYIGLDGLPVGRPRPNPFAIPDPELSYVAGLDTIVTGGTRLDPDIDDWGNVCIVVQTNTSGPATVGVADLDEFNPLHPLAQAQCKAYKDVFLNDASTASTVGAGAQAIQGLLDLVERTEQLSITTVFNPAHEGYEVLGFRIPNDLDYDTPQVMSETSWTVGLRTGESAHVWSRAFVTATSMVGG